MKKTADMNFKRENNSAMGKLCISNSGKKNIKDIATEVQVVWRGVASRTLSMLANLQQINSASQRC